MKEIIRHLIDSLVMDIDAIQDAEIERMRVALARMEGKNKRKSVKGSFSVKKKLRVAPITKRMRSTGVTPRTAKKADTRTSRSRQIQGRKLIFDSVSRSRSKSRPKSMNIDTPLLKSVQYTQSRKVRHKNARTVLNKMPAGGKSYVNSRGKRLTPLRRKPKGAYRGAVMPRWAKGETKHILMNDQCSVVDPATTHASKSDPLTTNGDETVLSIGELKAWSLNPCLQGNDITQRNGRSIDGTYLRIQGHIRNDQSSAGSKAYVRMLVLAVKGNQTAINSADTYAGGTPKAAFIQSNLFKKIDGSIVGFEPGTTGGDGARRVRSLQLPINKSLYTVLADQKMQLSTKGESFGSSDRLFDLKIPIKQRTVFGISSDSSSFEKNQLVFVVYSAEPTCTDTMVTGALPLEFESKYSFKDF